MCSNYNYHARYTWTVICDAMAASPNTSRRSRSVSTDDGTSSDKNRSSSSEQTSRDSSGPCSLLDRLRRPIPSDLSRKRRMCSRIMGRFFENNSYYQQNNGIE